MRTHLFSVLMCLVFVIPAFAEVQSVGSFGDPRHWQIRGLQQLDADEVLKKLSFDFAVVLAAHLQAPLEVLPNVLEQRLLTGLQRSGFPDARVGAHVNSNDGNIEIEVNEGPRIKTGRVLVTGVDGSDAASIVSALTEKRQDRRDASPTFDSAGNVLRWTGPDGKEPDKQEPICTRGTSTDCGG